MDLSADILNEGGRAKIGAWMGEEWVSLFFLFLFFFKRKPVPKAPMDLVLHVSIRCHPHQDHCVTVRDRINILTSVV